MDEEEKRLLRENNAMLKELLEIARKFTNPEYIKKENFNDFLMNVNANLLVHDLIKKYGL